MRHFIFRTTMLLIVSFPSIVFAAVPTASVSWSPSTIEYRGSSTVYWSSTDATSCTMSGSPTTTSGSWLATGRVKNQTTPFYCEGPGGTSSTVYATLTVNPPPVPTVTGSFSPSTVEYGGTSTLSWSSTGATSCTIAGVSGNPTSGSSVSNNRTTSYSVPIYCGGLGGTSNTTSPYLTVNPPPVPTITASFSPSTVEYGGTSTLSWSSTGATSCTIAGVSGNPTSGSSVSN
ncbi:MAG: hypothetical protein ACI9LM_001629, partial [Alteromonadaceae bacterium]